MARKGYLILRKNMTKNKYNLVLSTIPILKRIDYPERILASFS